MTTIDLFRRSLAVGGLALAALASGCAALTPATPVPTAWTGVTHLESYDQATGKFVRKGVALFKGGDAALLTIEGQFTSRDGTTLVAKNSYRFEDGSTFVHEGTGLMKQEGTLRTSTGTGTFTSGTGRFAGIGGTTSSSSRTLSPTEQVTEFKAQGTLAGK